MNNIPYEEQEEDKGRGLSGIVKTAGAVAGGALAFKHRLRIADAAINLTDEIGLQSSRILSRDSSLTRGLSNVSTVLKGVSDSLGDNPSLMRVGRSMFDNNLQEKMRRSYELSVRNSIKQRELDRVNSANTRSSHVNDFYRGFVKKEKDGLTRFEHAAVQQVRQKKIIEDMRGNSFLSRNGGEDLINALMNYRGENPGIIRNPKEYVGDFVSRLKAGTYKYQPSFVDKQQEDLFKKTLEQTLEKYKGPAVDIKERFSEEVERRAGAMKSAASFEFIRKTLQNTTILDRSVSRKGFQKPTIKEVSEWSDDLKRKHGLLFKDPSLNNKQIDIAKEMLKFVDEAKKDRGVIELIGRNKLPVDFDSLPADPDLYRHLLTGEVLDNRHIKQKAASIVTGFQEHTKIPFLNFNPVDLTPWQTLQASKHKEGLRVLDAGQVQGFVRGLDGETFDKAAKSVHNKNIKNPLNNSDHFYVGGSVYKYNETGAPEKIDEGLYLSPSQYGPQARMHRNMVNMSNREDEDTRGFIKKMFDIGHQEGQSRFGMYKDAWNKLGDEEYGPNVLKVLNRNLEGKTEEEQKEIIKQSYNILQSAIEKNTKPLSREAAESISSRVNEVFSHLKVGGNDFDFAMLSDDNYLKEASIALFKELETASGVTYHQRTTRSAYMPGQNERSYVEAEDPAVSEFKKWSGKLLDDPEGFDSIRTLAPKKDIPINEFMLPFNFVDDDTFVTGIEKLRRSFHQYALRALDNESMDFSLSKLKSGERHRTSISLLEDAYRRGEITKKDLMNAKDLEVLSDLGAYKNINYVDTSASEAKTFYEDVLSGSASGLDGEQIGLTGLGTDITGSIKRAQPWFGLAPEEKNVPVNASDFIVMRKGSLVKNFKEEIASINTGYLTQDTYDNWDKLINAELFTRDATAKLFNASKNLIRESFAGRYSVGSNLEDVTTSTGVIYGLTERLDNSLKNYGLGLSTENLGNFWSTMFNQYGRRVALPLIAYQQAKYFDDLTGNVFRDGVADAYVNTHETIAQIKEITGINKALGQWQDVFADAGLDQIGSWVGVQQFNALTFGAFNDFRSPEEIREFYEEGDVAIRKNRYWGIGSPTPWAGGKVEYYAPNWYRTLKSDYKYTDTMYGSKSEYYANHWMPTLTNPLAPIRHFITDPYHYEKKHEESRPYAITGGFSEIENIPIVGPFIDGTIGRALKPRRYHAGLEKAHEEYISEINQYIADQYRPVTGEGSSLTVSPTGMVETQSLYGGSGGAVGGGRPLSYGVNAGIVTESDFNDGVITNEQIGGYVGSAISVGYGDKAQMGQSAANANIASINQGLATQAGSDQSIRSPEKLMALSNMVLEDDIEAMERVDSLSGMANDAFYSASELTGIYGFFTKWQTNYDESWRGTTLAPSSLLDSPSRAFWDNHLGGYAGSLSEIGRRYVPRDMNKNYYSPIRNTMPEWLPGVEGYVDFLHGDPYCVSPDTLIEVYGGKLIRADEVNQGTVIKTHKGNWRKVEAINIRDVKEEEKVYEITVNTLSAFPMKVSEEHPILTVINDVYRNGKKSKPKEFSRELLQWTEAKHLEVGDYVAYPRPKNQEEKMVIDMASIVSEDMEIFEDEIYYGSGSKDFVHALVWLRKNGIPDFKWGERKVFLETMDWDEKAYENAQSSIRKEKGGSHFSPRFIEINKEIGYMLGNWLAEGSSDSKTGLVSFAHDMAEDEVCKKIDETIYKVLNRKTLIYGRENNFGVSQVVGCKPLALLLLHLFGSGAKNKKLPDWFINLPNDVLIEFLKGYFDGDGTHFNTNNRKRVGVKTVSIQLAYQIRNILLKLGIVSSVSCDRKERISYCKGKKISSGYSYEVNANGYAAHQLAIMLDYDLGEHLLSNKEKYFIDTDYIYMRVSKIDVNTRNEVPQVIGFEVGIDDSFCVAGVATHNTKIIKGEMRLPGEAYETLHQLHPDATGEYGIFDRFRILADVAPSSPQFKLAKEEVALLRQSGGMTEDMERKYEKVMDQVQEKSKPFRYYDKKFTNAEIKTQTVTITEVLDANTFMTKEHDSPIKLAGVNLSEEKNADVIEWMRQYIKPGEKIKIGYAEEAIARHNNDTYNTISAVVYTNKNEDGRFWFDTNKGTPINRIIANRSWSSDVKIEDDGSPAATAALYSSDMLTVGKYTEKITHDILPKLPFVGVLADKYLQVRTPIEMYKRNMVYGSDFRPWEEPIKSWVIPMVDTITSRTPLVAGAELAAIGHLAGKTTKARGIGRIAGFVIGAGLSSARVFKETANNVISGDKRAHIPKSTEREREVNEYFDRLKYVKYRGLYEKAKQLAWEEEGIDMDEFFDEASEKGRENRGIKRYLENRKRSLSLNRKRGYGDDESLKAQINDLNSRLGELDSDKEVYQAGEYATLAALYRREYEETLYHQEDASNRTALMKALTQKERDYMPLFLETSNTKERREILEHVTDDMRRILQNTWGLKADKKESIDSYFRDHYLPDASWAGWDASVNLDDIKIKVMQKVGLNPVNAGYWEADQERASNSGAEAIPIRKPISSLIDPNRLKEVLSGSGLSDVDVQITKTFSEGPGGINTGINIMHDMKSEVLDVVNESIHTLF